MVENKHQLFVIIGAALSSGFNSAITGSTSKIKGLGAAIQDMEKKSVLSASSFSKMGEQYNSLLGSINKQQAIIQKRAFYRSQILEVVALGAALVAPLKKAMDFEKAMDGVRSVVNFKEPDGLKKLGNTLSKLSSKLPVSATELANIAAVGGRFGVAENQLGSFAEKVGKATFTWGFAADEGAEKISNLMKIMGWSTQELDKQFDIINELGNRTGATANEIVHSIIKSSSGLSSFKFTTGEVGALVSTFKSMGQSAEEAGATLNTILQKLSVTGSLGQAGAKAFHRIGIGIHGFAKEVGESPQKAIMKLLKGISKLDNVTRRTALNDIFGKRAAMNVGLLVKHLKTYKENLHVATNMKNVNGSFWSDYSHAATTASGSWKTFLYALENVTRKIGDVLIEPFKGFLNVATSGLNKFSKFMDKNSEFVKNVIFGISALAGLKIGIFALGYASTFLFGGWNRLVIISEALKIGLSVIGIGVKNLIFSFLKFAGITGTIAGSFLGISKGIDGELVFSFETLVSRVNWLAGIGKAKIKTFWESLTNVKIPSFTEKFKAFFNELKNTTGIIERIKTFDLKFKLPDFSKITQQLREKLNQVNFSILSEKIKSMFSEIFNNKNVSFPKNIFENLNLSTLELAGGIAVLTASFFVLPNVIGVAGSALVALISLIPIAISGFSGLFQASWFLIGTVLPGLGGMLWSISEKLWYLGGKALPYVTKTFGIFAKITRTHPIIAALTTALTIGYWIYENWGHIGERISNFFTNLYNGVANFFKEIWNWCEKIGNFIGGFLDTVGTLGKVFGGVLKNVSSGIKKFILGEDVKIPIVEKIKESSFWKKFSFENKKDNATQKLELPEIEPRHSEINRTQNNNFTINIQADKKDNAETISQKVMNRVSDFSKTFLYDPVPEVL